MWGGEISSYASRSVSWSSNHNNIGKVKRRKNHVSFCRDGGPYEQGPEGQRGAGGVRPMHPPELRGGMGRGASKARTSYRMLDKRGLQRQWDPPLSPAPGPFSAKAFAGGAQPGLGPLSSFRQLRGR